MRLLLIRHADPDYVHDTITPKGHQEAELLAEQLLKEKIDYVYCSPLGRAQATCHHYTEKAGIKPAFPFGYGLSYTQFSIEDLQVLSAPDASWAITVKVKNTGNMAGAEVVQCYISDPVCSVERPVKELNAYQKVFLQPGEEKQVTIPLTERGFVYYDVERKAFVTEPGEYVVSVGNASDNCLLQECIVL